MQKAEPLRCLSLENEVENGCAVARNLHVHIHRVHSPSTYTGVGDMPHPSLGVAEVLEEALQFKLLHAWLDGLHHLTVGSTAHLVHIAEHCDLLGGLDHTATCTYIGNRKHRVMHAHVHVHVHVHACMHESSEGSSSSNFHVRPSVMPIIMNHQSDPNGFCVH